MNGAPVDPYAVLGVSRGATPAEVGRAFRALVRRHHPDVRDPRQTSAVTAADVASDAALQRVLAAYTMLRDPDSRREYDGSHPEVHRPEPPRGRQAAPTDPQAPLIRAGPVRWHPAAPAGDGIPRRP